MSKGNWKKKEKNWVEQTNNAATKWRNVREVNERRYKSDEDVKFFKQDQVSDKGCFATCFWHLVPGSSCYFAKVKTRNIHVYIGVVAVALEFWTTVPSCVSNHSSNHIACFDSHLCRFPPILFVQDVGQVWIEHRLNSAGEPTISLQRRESPRLGRTSAQQVPVPGNPYAWNITTCHHVMPCPHIIQRKSKVLIRFHLASLGPSRWIQVEAIRISGPPVHTSLSVRITWPRASISPSATWHGAWCAHLED